MNALFDARRVAADVVARAKPIDGEPKRPLFRSLPPSDPFPLGALGPLREAAEAIHLLTQAPPAICAQSVLGAATLAAQAHRDVELPGGGRKPITNFFVSIAESGERKSAVDQIALKPILDVERAWSQMHAEELAAYQSHHAAWKAAGDAAKKKGRGDRTAIYDALNDIGPEPKPPASPMILVNDFSSEAMILHLQNSRPFVGIFSAEGGVLMGGHAFSREKSMGTAALLNVLWDASPIRRTRVTTGEAFLPGRRCCAHLMMQQTVADRLLSDPMLKDIGVLPRMLVVAPESTIGTRMFRDSGLHGSDALDRYNARLRILLTLIPITSPEAPGVLDPPILKLSDGAKRIWIEIYNEIESAMGETGRFKPIQGFGAKMAEHAGRLAAVLAVYADPDAMEVDEHSMVCGIALAKHYAEEMLRMQGGSSVTPDLHLANRLLTWWQNRTDQRCYLAQIYQRGLNAISDAETARRIIGILEDHGYVKRLPPGILIDETPRREAWELIP